MQALSRNSDPLTSHLAADRYESKLPERQQQVLGLVANYPGKTAGELARKMIETYTKLPVHIAAATPHKRLPELERRNLVMRCPARKCGDSGELAATWVVAL